MKIQINDTNYSYYKRMFEVIWSHYKMLFSPGILQDDSDLVVILNRWEQKNKSIAKRGLKATLQDFISSIKEFSEDLKSAIDNDLTANNLPSLRDLQGIVKTTIARVLNRKKINSLEEPMETQKIAQYFLTTKSNHRRRCKYLVFNHYTFRKFLSCVSLKKDLI